MSEVRLQLLITVVHGTWPRGPFPKIVRFKQWARGLMQHKRLGPPHESIGSEILNASIFLQVTKCVILADCAAVTSLQR